MILLLLLLQAAGDHPLADETRATIRKDAEAVIANSAATLSERGDAFFRLGKFAESVADYEKMVEQEPALEKSHWRRGIAYFYNGQFEKAARQFEAYNSYDNVDRENGIWRFWWANCARRHNACDVQFRIALLSRIETVS